MSPLEECAVLKVLFKRGTTVYLSHYKSGAMHNRGMGIILGTADEQYCSLLKCSYRVWPVYGYNSVALCHT